MNRLRVLAGAWVLQALVLLQRDRRDGAVAARRRLRSDWRMAFLRLVVMALTVELALATCTLGRAGQ